ncbi:MAG: chitobiase/beta-hexosaminidase C-terminal domain-containing protein, partial [Muribaculaceae bacterium]|nr:chitobiase/beta-hexosaminidase C-terminal domain-containing protein [Muribaculaceae bacterium]
LAGYKPSTNNLTTPFLYKKVDSNKEQIKCSSPIEDTVEVDINSDPLTIFTIENEENSDAALEAMEITVDEDVAEDAYTITREDSQIKVVFHTPGEYSFTASTDPENENYWMSAVTAGTIVAVDPNVKPAAPVFTPEGGKLYTDTKVSIEGEGTIYYTLENIELSAANGTEYTEPFTISTLGKVTVKAISVSSKGKVSDVATATYTVKDAPLEYTIVFASKTSNVDDGKIIDKNTTDLNLIISEGIEYVAGVIDSENTYYGSKDGLKLGTSKNTGSIMLNLKKKVILTDVIVDAVAYADKDNGQELILNTLNGAETVKLGGITLSSDITEYVYNGFTYTEPVKAIGVEISSRAFIHSITVKYEEVEEIAPEVPALVGLEGIDFVEPNEDGMGMIMSQEKVTINFGEVPEGVEIHYTV